MTTQTFKLETLYAAFAPESNVSAWGACEDEALNNLVDQLRQRRERTSVQGVTRDEHSFAPSRFLDRASAQEGHAVS